jgi:PhnB protein
MKSINAYLTFDGNCRQAMEFYKQCLGGELFLMPFSESPLESPEAAKDRIMHATLKVGPAVLMASDAIPGMTFQRGDNFSVILGCESVEEQDRIFAALGQNGQITMALQDTFWNARFGVVLDAFGTNWMLNYPKAS